MNGVFFELLSQLLFIIYLSGGWQELTGAEVTYLKQPQKEFIESIFKLKIKQTFYRSCRCEDLDCIGGQPDLEAPRHGK